MVKKHCRQTAIMKTIIIDLKGYQLPSEWAEKAGVLPDQAVEVTIQPPREKPLKRLFMIMDEASQEAEAEGLTEEKLAELLDDQ